MKSRSLRLRLSWTNAVVVAVVFLCVGYVRYITVSYRVYNRFDTELQRDVALLSSHLLVTPEKYEIRPGGLSEAEAVSLREMQSESVVSDAMGRPLHADLCDRPIVEMLRQGVLFPVLQSSTGITEVRTPDGSRFRFASSPLRSDGNLPLVVHLGRSSEPMGMVVDEYKLMYTVSVPIILFLSVTVAWYLAGRALKPFEEVAEALERYTSKNLHSPIRTRHEEREVRKLVDAFNQLVERLNDSFCQMSKFNSDVAHELRTPLAVLQGETEIALQTPGLPEEMRAVLGSNLEELDRLSRIVKDMLTLAEADAGTQIITEHEVRLVPLVRDLVEQMRILAADRSIGIVLDRTDEASILGDELWIRRALLNLLDNAIKYSKTGGRIEVTVQTAGPTVRVSVRDEGIGISADDLPRIFDRLYRSDPARSRSTGGAGLGLAFVKWIVEAHEGRISVESQPDCGTVFTLEFPQLAAAAAAS